MGEHHGEHPSMRAMVLTHARHPLVESARPLPEPDETQVRVRVRACGSAAPISTSATASSRTRNRRWCRATRSSASSMRWAARSMGSRSASGWGSRGLGGPAGGCVYCRAGQENLCETARFTGNTLDGGYADDALADVRYVFPIHGDYTDAEAFLALAPKVPVCTRVETFPLERANEALDRLRDGRLQGAAVLTIE